MKNTSKVKVYLINAYSNYDPDKFFISGSDKVALALASEDLKNSVVIGPSTIKRILPNNLKFLSSQSVFTRNIIFDYLIRTVNSFFILKSLGKNFIVLSSSDFFCDVIPGFLVRKRNEWYCFTFHLYPSFFDNFKLRDFFGKMLQDFSYILFKNAHKVFTSNFECVEYLNRKFKITSSIKIPLGIKIDNYQVEKVKDIDILFLGRIKESKGIFDLPEIISIVKSKIPNLRVVVIGNGPKSEKDRIEALDKKFNSNITFMGSVEDSVVIKTLSKSKLLVQLDSEGGFGLNIIEALASGCSVVGYELPSYKDNFFDLRLDLTPQKDKEAVSKDIIKLLTKFEVIDQRSKLNRFDWSSIYNNIFSS